MASSPISVGNLDDDLSISSSLHNLTEDDSDELSAGTSLPKGAICIENRRYEVIIPSTGATVFAFDMRYCQGFDVMSSMRDLEKSETFLSLPELETFRFYIEEKNSGSTTVHADISLPEYDSFHFEIESDQGLPQIMKTLVLVALSIVYSIFNPSHAYLWESDIRDLIDSCLSIKHT
ncbi:hypothetical protein Tco_0755198 [Tanacetum coccineum]